MTSSVKIVALFLTVAAVLFAIFYFMDAGADRERAKIERENQNAVENADDYATSLGDCDAAGRVYNFETGKCRGAERSYWKLPSWLTR